MKDDTEYGWVIEAASPSAPIMYWDGGEWTTNHMRPVRFARKVDADRVMINLPTDARRDGMRSAEHAWTTAPVELSGNPG